MPKTWMDYAQEHIGLLEKPGPGSNPKVVELFALAGFPGIKDDGVPWCAAFVGAMLVLDHIEPSHSLLALSYNDKWKGGFRLNSPVWGCIGTKTRTGGGHVGFVIGANPGTIIMISGNANNSVNIAEYPRSSFVGFYFPKGRPFFGKTLPLTIAGARVSVTET